MGRRLLLKNVVIFAIFLHSQAVVHEYHCDMTSKADQAKKSKHCDRLSVCVRVDLHLLRIHCRDMMYSYTINFRAVRLKPISTSNPQNPCSKLLSSELVIALCRLVFCVLWVSEADSCFDSCWNSFQT